MTTIRRGYRERIARGAVWNGEAVVERPTLPADERAVLEALHEGRYPSDAALATVQALVDRGWVVVIPTAHALPHLALTNDGLKALARSR